MNRAEQIEKSQNQVFDVCVIGSGASGAGVALDATLRGLSVCLVEKGDLVSETSSKSTKLIHGGVRYLEQAFKNLDLGQLKQVKHGLAERKFLLENGRHVSRPLGIITPVFSLWEAFYYTVGLKLYGLFAAKDSLPAARWLSKKEAILLAPNLNSNIHSAVMYFDGQLDDARYAFALNQTAHDQGAVVINYIEVLGFGKDENQKLQSIKCLDHLGKNEITIKAKHFINCTGPFADSIRLMANSNEEARIKPSKGVHIVIPRKFFDSERAMLIPKTKDGRLIFVIPFRTSVMVGTTDTAYNKLSEEPILEKEEVSFLLDTVKDYLTEIPKEEDITAGFGGLRPLISSKSKSPGETKTLLRDHEVEYDMESGLLSLLGGKWTTYRLMAQDMVDKICELLGTDAKATTQTFKLIGSQNPKPAKPDHFDLEVYQYLCKNYGEKTANILDLCKNKHELANRVHKDHPYILAEIIYCVHHEMIQKPRDFLARRTRFELMHWADCLDSIGLVCAIMGKEMQWTDARIQEEIKEYKNLIEQFQEAIK